MGGLEMMEITYLEFWSLIIMLILMFIGSMILFHQRDLLLKRVRELSATRHFSEQIQDKK